MTGCDSAYEIMSVQPEDRTTIDMFSRRERGRPKTSPYDRNTQLKISKRQQRARDKENGLRRLEIKLSGMAVDQLDQMCAETGRSRAELIEEAIAAFAGDPLFSE